MLRALRLPRACRHAAVALLLLGGASAIARPLQLMTTPAIQQTGLLAQLLPKLRQATGLEVQVVAAAGPQALASVQRGDADLALLDDERGELARIAGKPAVVMSTRFLLVGPKGDPAAAAGKDIVAGFARIEATRSLFISRGDQSLTHAMEQRFWSLAGVKKGKGGAHRECKCPTAGALDIAATAFGYSFAERGAWQSFRNRVDLVVLVDADPRLVLPYVVLAANHARRIREDDTDAQKAALVARTRDAQKAAQWFSSPAGQAAIGAHRVNGEPFFEPQPAR